MLAYAVKRLMSWSHRPYLVQLSIFVGLIYDQNRAYNENLNYTIVKKPVSI